MQRYATTRFTLIRQPRPADRETRLYVPRDRTIQRPRREGRSHV
ncbi:MAG: hypothetical protein PUC00_00915 [Clostridiales bacterium]|nr:hypothetical protein [Clostridiales bacterium]